MTAPASPASTVMFAASYMQYAEATEGGWYGADYKWVLDSLIDSPDCWDWSTSLCWDGWGNSQFWGPSFFTGMTDVSGAKTGGVSLRAADSGTVTFVDGHVKKMKAGAMAIGTNWTKQRDPSQVVVTDRSTYMWDLQ